MADYEFITEWRIDAPQQAVWEIIRSPQHWPLWWHGLQSVSELRRGNPDGTGEIWRFAWRGALPYRLTVDIEITRVEPMVRLEGAVSGALRGTGCWQLRDQGNATLVRFDWYVNGPRSWMRLIAPVMRPLFRWNHSGLMEAGHQGLSKHLAGR